MISELKELGKPFLLLLNSARPESDEAQTLRAQLAETYDVTCLAVSCLDLSQRAVTEIIQSVLFEFPLEELQLFLPDWVDALPQDHPIKTQVFQAVREHMDGLHRIRDVRPVVEALGQCQPVTEAAVTAMRLGTGTCQARLDLPGASSTRPCPSRRGSPSTTTGSCSACWGSWPRSRPTTKKSGRRHGGGPGHGVRHRHPRRRGSWSWRSRRSSSRGGAMGCASGPRPPAST